MIKKYSFLALTLVSFMGAATAQIDTVNIDFGETMQTAPAPWNNLTDYEVGAIADLNDCKGNLTGISIAVTDSFSMDGAGGNSNDPNYPKEVSNDYFYGNTQLAFGMQQPTGGFTLNGLNPSKVYSFGFYGSRYPISNRETKYIVNGAVQDSASLVIGVTTPVMVWVNGVVPKSDGSVEITVTAVPNATDNPTGYYYINAMSFIESGTVGINETEMAQISIFPNPAKDVINVSFESGDDVKHIEVYNLNGSKVLEVMGEGSSTQAVNISGLVKGVYTLKANSSNGELMTRFTIE